jgi:hypothetical protein
MSVCSILLHGSVTRHRDNFVLTFAYILAFEGENNVCVMEEDGFISVFRIKVGL